MLMLISRLPAQLHPLHEDVADAHAGEQLCRLRKRAVLMTLDVDLQDGRLEVGHFEEIVHEDGLGVGRAGRAVAEPVCVLVGQGDTALVVGWNEELEGVALVRDGVLYDDHLRTAEDEKVTKVKGWHFRQKVTKAKG